MDNHFNPGYLSYGQSNQQQGLGSFGNLSAQNQQQDSPQHTTLPPLQSQNGGFAQFGNLSYAHPGSQAHTPTTPHTPATSSMGGQSSNAYSHMSPQNTMGPPSAFNHTYGMSQSMMYPSSTATSLPSATSSTGLPTIRPMPPGGVSGQIGLPSMSSAQFGNQPAFMQNEEAPTHVVGSQGRRGILPSAPGRPNPPAQGATQSTKSMIPQKDADGKYPCPHCNKTYLHAKHLKRHLLRHTGDRPYMCHLCKDTFSRSDILKRHFQKCSIRRGNPTGANHLAHQRRNTNSNRLSMSQQDGPIGLAGLAEVANPAYNPNIVGSSPTVNGDISTRTSRANSLITPGNMSHRGSVAGLGILGSNVPNDNQMGTMPPYQQALQSHAMHNGTNGGPMQSQYAFNQQPQLNGNMYNPQQQPMSFLGQQSSRFDNNHNSSASHAHPNGGNVDASSGAQIDWSRMFNQGGQDGFIGGGQTATGASSQGNIKIEEDAKPNFGSDVGQDSFLGSLYSHPAAFGSETEANEDGIPGFPNWSTEDPLQAKVDSLMQYCFPDGTATVMQSGNQGAEIVRLCLSAENVKHFAEHYTSYQGHWPIIHMPTFKLTDAHNSLVLAIICIGAIYSPRMNVDQTRRMMDFVRKTILANSSLYQRVLAGQTEGLGNYSWEIDEMQALIMLSTMFTWHGDPRQREIARNDFSTIVRVAKTMGLCQTVQPGHYAYSPLHYSTSGPIDRNSWSWYGWLEQEKRSRALYLLFLCDAAMGMYFNSMPQFDPLEIRLPLPADDAVWDARDQEECASALGLNGPKAQGRNVTGTRKPRQPGMREAMRSLLEANATFQQSATNAYSKFVLIHALIVRIIACQKMLLHPDGPFQGFNMGFSSSGPATPLSQNDWLDHHGNGSLSGTNSGHATPTDGFGPSIHSVQAQQEKKRLSFALDKWKRMWDMDMDLQYPPHQSHMRRFGFSRDGVHFFYLGRSFMQSNKPAEWTAPADVRFKQVMGLLKKIKQFVVGDARGQDIGSVGDIDDAYGTDTLTLDMKLLFKPYNINTDSPIAGVQTHAL